MHINGLINFDKWRIGVRAQDFIKLEHITLNPLKMPEFNQAFYQGYGNFYKETSSKDFKKKIEIYKLKWLLEEFNNNPVKIDLIDEMKIILNI